MPSIVKGLAAGAIGGAVASFAMNQFQAAASKLFENPEQHPDKKERARQAQGWKEHKQEGGGEEENATVKAAVAVLGPELSDHQKQAAGSAMHYAFGIVSGAAYGAAVEEWPAARVGQGTVFGAALWLTADEIAVPAFRLSKPPAEYPVRVHAMALSSHLVYGVVTELVRRALRGRPGRRRW
jgi:putative membrane protein